MDQTQESTGEKYIRQWLTGKNIQYYYRHKVYDLDGSPWDYLEPDFYLPEYDLYIEFWGLWNNKEKGPMYRKHAKQKMAIYYANNKDFVSVFPNQLHFLDYLLENELGKRLKERKSDAPVFKRMERRNSAIKPLSRPGYNTRERKVTEQNAVWITVPSKQRKQKTRQSQSSHSKNAKPFPHVEIARKLMLIGKIGTLSGILLIFIAASTATNNFILGLFGVTGLVLGIPIGIIGLFYEAIVSP